MKSTILEILKTSPDIISGEELSKRLEVSRVSIWKHIKALQELGYDIVSSSKGYSYASENDLLYPWEFGRRESLIHHYQTLPSTMDMARDLARKGAPDGSVVIAEVQKKGRGRMQRHWLSQRGGIYMTLILRPRIPAVSGFLLNFMTGTSLVETIREFTGIDARVKWPNDLLVGRKKLSGMIAEMETAADMITFVNIGIGINVNNNPSTEEKSATSIAQLLGYKIRRKELLYMFFDNLAARMEQMNLDTAVQDWKQYTMTIGREVEVVTLTDTTRGKAVDVDDSGALHVKLPDNTIKKVVYGDCFHR